MNKFLNTIITGNCAEIMQQFPDNCIALTVTSPPYDNLRKYTGFSFVFEKIASELFRITKPGGVVVWICADATINGSETGTSFKQVLFFKETGFNLHDTMIFQKQNPIPQIYRKRYTNIFEYMFILSKGPVATHNPLTVPCLHAGLPLNGTTYKNYSKGRQIRTKQANPVKKEKIKGNIWEYVVGKRAEDQDAKEHPAPFPMALARDHILSWSNESDIVLDPMCGSGTTCVAAIKLNRKFIGIDESPNYCEIAKKRIRFIIDSI